MQKMLQVCHTNRFPVTATFLTHTGQCGVSVRSKRIKRDSINTLMKILRHFLTLLKNSDMQNKEGPVRHSQRYRGCYDNSPTL